MDLLREYTEKVSTEFHSRLEDLILYKISLLEKKASEEGYSDLAHLLNSLNYSNIKTVKKEFEKKGYTLIVEYEREEFSCDGEVFKITLDGDSVSLKVQKTILKV